MVISISTKHILVINFISGKLADISQLASKETKEVADIEPAILGWRYCITLLKLQYDEGLLDHKTCLSKTLDLFKQCSHEQTIFLIPLIVTFMKEFARSRSLINRFINSCLAKLEHISFHRKLSQFIYYQYKCLVSVTRYAFLEAPDSFVSTTIWSRILNIKEDFIESASNEERQGLFEIFLMINNRNLMFSADSHSNIKIELKVLTA